MNRINPATDKADTINDRVRIARVISEMSQKEIAARIGKPQNTICEIEQGNRKVPIELIQEYGKMGFDLNWIIYGTTDDNALSDLINHLNNNKKILLSIYFSNVIERHSKKKIFSFKFISFFFRR